MAERKPAPKPTFVLDGRIVCCDANDEVIEDGRVVIAAGRIAALLRKGQPRPSAYAKAVEVDTAGTIYPGLIDLHNHFVYNSLPLWAPPKTYQNRTQWAREGAYATNVALPVRALAAYETTAKALVRYVEAKALAGGTTTGQGIRTRVNGGLSLFRGAMRNVEQSDDPQLPNAGTRVPNLYPNPANVLEFRGRLDALQAYFYHLAEGTDTHARETYLDLTENHLVRASLVGIHCLGLAAADLVAYGNQKAKVIWSPFSNLLLYGRTLHLSELAASKAVFALGSDWSPTGSKNLLHELKVASWEAHRQGATLSDRDLVHALTSAPAQILGWAGHLGSIQPGFLADLIVVAPGGEPFSELVRARERQIALVVVGGEARYGAPALMNKLHSRHSGLESATVDGSARYFAFDEPSASLGGLPLAEAQSRLSEAMEDLPRFRERAEEGRARLSAIGIENEPFTVELDNEYSADPGDPDAPAVLMADWSQIADHVDLDPFPVDEPGYWKQLHAQKNLDPALIRTLEQAYAH